MTALERNVLNGVRRVGIKERRIKSMYEVALIAEEPNVVRTYSHAARKYSLDSRFQA